MRGDYDQTEPPRRQRDRELTLGATTVLGLLLGAVLVCAACFAVGYSMGFRGATDSALAARQKEQSALTATGKPKPSATPQTDSERAAYAPPAALRPSPAAADEPQQTPWSAQPAGQPALPAPTPYTPPQAPARPAPEAPSGPIMVQIAAVAHEEDADVLTSALRKRSYAVVVRRAAADSLLHVQIGPFANRNEAIAMRNKLLADGYNAVLLP